MVQRHPNTPTQRALWVAHIIAHGGEYGQVTALSRANGVLAADARRLVRARLAALEQAFVAAAPPVATKALERAILTLLVKGHASDRGIQACLRHQSLLDGLPVAGPADVAMFIFDTPPGAQTPPHTCPGLVVGTVIKGELTMIIGGTEQAYKVGEVFTGPPGVVAVAHNRGAVWSRVLGSMVIPRGAAPSKHPPVVSTASGVQQTYQWYGYK